MQFVESTPVAEVLDKDVDGSIQVTGRVVEETNNLFFARNTRKKLK